MNNAIYKTIKVLFILIGTSAIPNKLVAQNLAINNLKGKEIYPTIRNTTSPSNGESPKFNSPSFQWPSKKNANYSIRISTSKKFDQALIEKNKIAFALFNPHQQLTKGKWYWQYKINHENWNPVDSFDINASTRIFPTVSVEKIINNIPAAHPRILVNKSEINNFRITASKTKEAIAIINEANKILTIPIPKEGDALPKYQGKDKFENDKIASLASKWSGRKIQESLNIFSQAYILTGDVKYFKAAKLWMLEVANWDPLGPSHTNNFADGGIMSSMAIGLDSFWDLLTETERNLIKKNISTRADQFYKLWMNQVEVRSSSMHVWQHIMHNLLETGLALKGEHPTAENWIEYIYELWIAQSPKMAEEDGAWINGSAYFGMNALSLIEIPTIFKKLSGVDFMTAPWFQNNPKWLIYSFPPNSTSDGFGNDGERYKFPWINYAGYTDALARLTNNPSAAWYANAVAKSVGKEIADDAEFRWFRIRDGIKKTTALHPLSFKQDAFFQEVGVGYMHTNVQDTKNDLFLSLRSSPFGPMSHTHADHNTFNIAYGGKRLFYNTGYRPAMGDPHFLGWYKHTQGHNGVLIDGHGQPFSDGAFGWIPRSIQGEQISYAMGDASNAYSGIVDGKEIDHGMKLFRRHYLMLRPSIIIIYDELEADHAAEWSWLLHNYNGFTMDAKTQTVFAENETAKAQVTLFSSSDIQLNVSDQFSVPVDNWTNKINEDGDTLNFVNQWHLKAASKQKAEKMRYLAVIQIKPDGRFEKIIKSIDNGDITVGNYHIKASMNINEAAHIQINNIENTLSFVSSGTLMFEKNKYIGTDIKSAKLIEKKDGKIIFKEVLDEMPPAMKRMMSKIENNK
ncbi:MAG: DUF4962 domain-containing protein [Chitinophagia bacterium]|nr:DUF4962 domain-containing protein [Chitinophagia bacterium]